MTKRRYPIPTRKTVPRHEYAPAPRRRVRTNPVAIGAITFLALLAVGLAAAPLLTYHDPLAMAPDARLLPPGPQHLAGTDLFGRDVLSRLLYGGRRTLGIAVLAVLIAGVPGTALGLIAGYYGRWVDRLISWLVDVMLSFPSILLALTLVAALGPGTANVVLAVSVATIPNYTRLVRGQVLSARRQPYVRAAVTVGATNTRILLRHILPNVFSPILVLATLDLGWAILNASALSFLGLGVQPPAPEWGLMLNEGRAYLRTAPWVITAPGLAIAATVLAVNLLGDAWRDVTDPLRKR
ncbi:MAG TPA: ABC transporter permease [Anaerolineae bacterium]|nr:ABC transporter permease [Anaerolineae bacterium]